MKLFGRWVSRQLLGLLLCCYVESLRNLLVIALSLESEICNI